MPAIPVAVTDGTRPEVTAKLTVDGVEPKSTPLEGGGKTIPSMLAMMLLLLSRQQMTVVSLKK